MALNANSPIVIVADFDAVSGQYSLTSASVRLPALDPSSNLGDLVEAVGRHYPGRPVKYHKDSRVPALSH